MIWIDKQEALARAAAERERLPEAHASCVMCALGDGFPPEAERLAESSRAVCVLDRFAARPGHVLVVLRRHVEQVASLSWDEYADVQRLSWEAARALDRAFSPRRIFVASLGAAKARVNSFPHHHVHVIPVDAGDERDRPASVLSWEHGVFVFGEGEARAMADAIRAAWPAHA